MVKIKLEYVPHCNYVEFCQWRSLVVKPARVDLAGETGIRHAIRRPWRGLPRPAFQRSQENCCRNAMYRGSSRVEQTSLRCDASAGPTQETRPACGQARMGVLQVRPIGSTWGSSDRSTFRNTGDKKRVLQAEQYRCPNTPLRPQIRSRCSNWKAPPAPHTGQTVSSGLTDPGRVQLCHFAFFHKTPVESIRSIPTRGSSRQADRGGAVISILGAEVQPPMGGSGDG